MGKGDTKLRDHLLDALKTLPGTRRFRLHVLVAAPHKYAELFPYASARPRVYAQDILILCSEQQSNPRSSESDADAEPQRVFVAAIEANLFHIPTTTSAILYIAKVDSTGQGSRPSPTGALVRALVSYYAHPTTRPAKLRGTTLWVHLFARAERQYLFPNSADHPEKKPLNDVKLCAWWKRVLDQVVQELDVGEVKMYYVLPGMNELEAVQALGETLASGSKASKWIYQHPYSQTEVSLPYAYAPRTKSKDEFNLGQLIPSFDDDPKSRFMDEIACTTQVDGLRSPQRKRRRVAEDGNDTGHKKDSAKEKEREMRPLGELGVVSADEFWERMSFRQECVAGAITGFFVIVFPSGSDSDSPFATANPLAPQPGEVSQHLVQRVIHSLMTGHEFSTTERSLRATSILEASIRSLCSGPLVPDAQKERPPFLGADDEDQGLANDDQQETPSTQPSQFLELPRTPRRRVIPLEGNADDISPNPFPEPEPSADTYSSFVYGELGVSNPDLPPPALAAPSAGEKNGDVAVDGSATGGVTVLTVRKKKRK